MTSFPTVLDDSILHTFASCEEKARRQYFQHWQTRQRSVHLNAGGAYAEGLEALRESFFIRGEPLDLARGHAAQSAIRHYDNPDLILDERKTLDRVLGALDYYCHFWNPKTDQYRPIEFPGEVTGIEFNFLVELPDEKGNSIPHPETGDPLLYTGRADAIVQDDEGTIFLLDDKTESQLGETWGRRWRLRSQFTGYQWAAREQLNLPVRGTLVRGMCFYTSIRQETGTCYVARQIISQRTHHDINTWLRTTRRRIVRLIQAWRDGTWEFALNDACNAFGGCPFQDICIARNPDPWLRQDFQRRRWDPVHRQEIPLDDEGRTLGASQSQD